MPAITLEQAQTLIARALQKGGESGFKPLAVAVLDPRGQLKAYAAQEGTSLLRFQIAFGKANGALGMGMGSRGLKQVADERPQFVNALSALANGGLVPVPGGVLIRDGEGAIVGAVGISGDTSDNDETCAIAGIESVGLRPDPG